MFNQYREQQFETYHEALEYFESNPQSLINIEQFIMNEISHFLDLQGPDIIRDYNEASYLYPFWQNYPPEDRGRSPRHDQFPWIEVGEKVFGSKLSRYFNSNFRVYDTGIPSGPDDRYVIQGSRIRSILGITDYAWVFIDIKSVGPRDNFFHAVMSNYQISGSGNWNVLEDGVFNDVMEARGQRRSHPFYCSIPPVYVRSDRSIMPVVHVVIKPIYEMITSGDGGQPLSEITCACIPNGILLTRNPNYLETYPSLFYPGKDDQGKAPRKVRARVSFELLQEIAPWRISSYQINQQTLFGAL